MKLTHVLSQGLLVAVLAGLTSWGALYAEGPTNTRAVVRTAMNETEAEIYKAGGLWPRVISEAPSGNGAQNHPFTQKAK